MQIGSLECILLLAGWCDRFASSVVIRKMRAGISRSDRATGIRFGPTARWWRRRESNQINRRVRNEKSSTL
jgi:hypothetical protein